ncbi:hypothetical protein LCGC14_0980760 [marine sediment metagenome]|uniref:DZANK-type domain-containing protein n=1 Tax=marine sediment metagenome TaxID=412755 RepID=A0A0F9RFC8_9ZZZZ
MSKQCPTNECYALIGEKDVFCYKCGSKLVKPKICLCKRELCKADSFCPECGRPAK